MPSLSCVFLCSLSTDCELILAVIQPEEEVRDALLGVTHLG